MPRIPLQTMYLIRNEFEKNLARYSLKKHWYTEQLLVYELSDSLLISCEISVYDAPLCTNIDEMYKKYNDSILLGMPSHDGVYYKMEIEEITYNDIYFKYNHTQFLRDIKNFLGIDVYIDPVITYTKFRGYTRIYWCPEVETTAERMDKIFPKLNVRERYERWPGLRYNFIVIDFQDVNNIIQHAVAYTVGSPQSYIIKLGNYFIKHGVFTDAMRCSYWELNEALSSWKGTSRKDRLEKNLKYFWESKYFKEKDDVWRYADVLLQKANSGLYDKVEKNSYLKPVNKWVSEEMVYKITKKLYNDCAVIYQHRPSFLISSFGGQMSYDIFISKLNVAIEYQGEQHFRPIDFFGGIEAYEKLRKRDEEKRILSKQHGIKLIYINYYEEITAFLIKTRVEG